MRAVECAAGCSLHNLSHLVHQRHFQCQGLGEVGNAAETNFANVPSCGGTDCAAPWIEGNGTVYTFTLYNCDGANCTYTDHTNARATASVQVRALPSDAWDRALVAIKVAEGTDSQNFWYWAWYWQYQPAFRGAPAGYGVVGSISPSLMEQIILAGGGDGFHSVSAEQWLMYYRQAICPGC